MNLATFLSYFSLALFLLVMYLRYQYVKNQLLAARRKREIAFMQQMSKQFKREKSATPQVQSAPVVSVSDEMNSTDDK
ncbi:MAG: hypothetical protein R3E08_05595 [Thiotrichaceae bacterium]